MILMSRKWQYYMYWAIALEEVMALGLLELIIKFGSEILEATYELFLIVEDIFPEFGS